MPLLYMISICLTPEILAVVVVVKAFAVDTKVVDVIVAALVVVASTK